MNLIKENKVFVISKRECKNCDELKSILQAMSIKYSSVLIEEFLEENEDDHGEEILDDLNSLKQDFNIKAYPMVFISGDSISFDEIKKMNRLNINLENFLTSKGIEFTTRSEDF